MERAALRAFLFPPSFLTAVGGRGTGGGGEEGRGGGEQPGPPLGTTLRDFLTTDESYSRDILF